MRGGGKILRTASVASSRLSRYFTEHVEAVSMAGNRQSEDRFSVGEVKLELVRTSSKDPEKQSAAKNVPQPTTRCLLCSVFDGHGGGQISAFLQRFIQMYFQEMFVPSDDIRLNAIQTTVEALQYAYEKAERNLWTWFRPVEKLGFSGVVKVGSCAVSCAILKDKWNDKAHAVVVANLGDCRCIIGRSDGRVVPMTNVHNVNNKDERRKIREAHPDEPDVVQCQNVWVSQITGETSPYLRDDPEWVEDEACCYIKGCLQPSRTFGDFYMKKPEISRDHEFGGQSFFSQLDEDVENNIKQKNVSYPYCSAIPEITIRHVTDQDEFILLGSDGLWDYLNDSEIVRIVLDTVNGERTGTIATNECAEALLDEVLSRAAVANRIPKKNLEGIPPGSVRRKIHDDTTILIIHL